MTSTQPRDGISGLVERRFSFLKDQPLFPLFLLLALNAVDEFDRSAFSILAPEIRDAFGLSNTAYGLIVGFTTVTVLLSGLPIGLLGDRLPRTKLVIVAALVWASMSILTGLAPVLMVLVIARFFSGLGRVSNEAIHTSLLTDYYPQHLQGRIFGMHRAGNPIGFAIGPLIAGTVAASFGDWRWAFFIVALPTFFITVFAFRLREPSRGEAEDSTLAAEAAKEAPIPFARGWRWLFSVASLKRLYVSAFFGGGVIFALQAYVGIYFSDAFGVEELDRGFVGSGTGVSQLLGTVLGAYLADRMRRFSLGRMAFVAAIAVSGIGLGVFVMGLAPVLWIAIAGNFLSFFAIGVWISPNTSVLAVVLPARIRSLGIGVGVMFFGAGGFVFTIIAGAISDASGIKAAITTLSPILFVASGIYIAAARHVNDDAQQALQALALEVELRHERLTAGSQALLVCRSLDVGYEGVQVLFGVDFEVQEGEIVALLGTNGAGKSTLLKAISGVVHPKAGAIFFEGENTTFFEPHESAAHGIVQVPGGRGTFASLTVRENLELSAWLFRRDRDYVDNTLREILAIFPVLRNRMDTKAGDLSGGEQQMITLAQAFSAKPKLLMVDELSLGLAPILVEQLLQAVKAIHARGTTIVLVEQSVNIALSVAQRAYFMEKGEIRFSGPAEELMGRTDLIRSVFLEGSGSKKVIAPKIGKEISVATDGRQPLLQVKGLSASYGGIRAVDDVTFDLFPGQILGLIGPNGAGKTTLFDLISGYLKPDSGRIFLLEDDITDISPQARALRGLGRSFQDAKLFPSLTVIENIALALDRHLEVKEPVAAALGLPAMRTSEKHATARADELIERMGLTAFREKFVHELSTGSRRIVDIACALALGPKVLILDEPSSGIAQAETEALGPMLESVRADLDCALLVIEHDIPLISSIANEMIALDLGRVIAKGNPEAVVRDPNVVMAYLGTDETSIARSGDGDRPTAKPKGKKTSTNRAALGAKKVAKSKKAVATRRARKSR